MHLPGNTGSADPQSQTSAVGDMHSQDEIAESTNTQTHSSTVVSLEPQTVRLAVLGPRLDSHPHRSTSGSKVTTHSTTAADNHHTRYCSGAVKNGNHHPQGGNPPQHQKYPLQMKAESISGHYQRGPSHTTHWKSDRGNTAHLQSGPQLQHSTKPAGNPGHRVEVTRHISKAVPTQSTPGSGREHRTVGRVKAAYLQSGPHPQQVSQPPGTLCIGIHRGTANLDPTPTTNRSSGPDNSTISYPRPVTQGVGILHLNQLLYAQMTTLLHKQFDINIGFIRFDCVNVIFPFQHWTNYAPVKPKYC